MHDPSPNPGNFHVPPRRNATAAAALAATLCRGNSESKEFPSRPDETRLALRAKRSVTPGGGRGLHGDRTFRGDAPSDGERDHVEIGTRHRRRGEGSVRGRGGRRLLVGDSRSRLQPHA